MQVGATVARREVERADRGCGPRSPADRGESGADEPRARQARDAGPETPAAGRGTKTPTYEKWWPWTAGDLDGDGKLDLVVANAQGNTGSVLVNQGAANFGAKADYPTGKEPVSIALGDLDGDGTLDPATAHSNDSPVSVRLAQCR